NQTQITSTFDPILKNAATGFSQAHTLISNPAIANPTHLVLADDYEPSRFYALNGSILGGVIMTNEQTWFMAGKDIRRMTYELRNIGPTDVSLLEAGRDIIGSRPLQQHISQFTRNDPVTGASIPVGSIEIQGPGALVLSAGRNFYGTITKIQSS